MNDPHVDRLFYDLVPLDPGASFKSPSSVTITRAAFVGELTQGRLTIEMRDHFAEVQEARESAEPTVRAWEATALLEGKPVEFRFVDARIIDRDPPRGEVAAAMSDYVVGLKLTPSGQESHEIASYPRPPDEFILDRHTDVLVRRYRRAAEGRISFIECAAFTSSYIDKRFGAGDRKRAAAALDVDYAILSKLGEQSSAVGDLETVRKIDMGWQDRPHTAREWTWMIAAVPMLIRRISQLAAKTDRKPGRLTMSDLPPL